MWCEGILLFLYYPLHPPVLSSVSQSCLTLCDPMDCRTPGLPVHHQLLEFTQTHVHWVSDAIYSSQSLSSPSPPAFNLPNIKVFSNESALRIRWSKYWSFQLQHQFPMNSQDWFPLGWTGWISLLTLQCGGAIISNNALNNKQFPYCFIMPFWQIVLYQTPKLWGCWK